MAVSTPPGGSSLAICPACGHPTLGKGLCALCALCNPTAATEIDLVDVFDAASDL